MRYQLPRYIVFVCRGNKALVHDYVLSVAQRLFMVFYAKEYGNIRIA